MLKLDNITVVCVTSVRIQESIDALVETAKHGQYSSIKLITHRDGTGNLPDVPTGIIVEECPKLTIKGTVNILYMIYINILIVSLL